MLEVGWSMLQLPASIEAAWPQAPHMIQKALNASNEIANPPTILEVRSLGGPSIIKVKSNIGRIMKVKQQIAWVSPT